MLPYKTLILYDREVEKPVFVQIAQCFIAEIVSGRIGSDLKLPSTRDLAIILEVHRKTIVAAYDELEAQGWVVKKPSIGTFVISKVPEVQDLDGSLLKSSSQSSPSFLEVKYDFEHFDNYTSDKSIKDAKYRFDDGYPDIRLAPLDALSRAYGSLLRNAKLIKGLNYSADFKGDYIFRLELAKYLQDTRGISTSPDNIIITRGSLMAFYLLFTSTIQAGDNVVVGEPGYNALNEMVRMQQGNVLSIPVDEDGLDIVALEKILQRRKVKFLYVIPHHHHPTTVRLSPERRLRLLQLSIKYNFGILEDDYDFDFHYESSPILPLASLNAENNVIYVGSFSKLIAPVLRLGFLVANKEFVDQLSMLRRYIDWKSDPILERAVCHLMKNGEIKRYLNKSRNAYRKRRDFLCSLLDSELPDGAIQYAVPEGGMAVWTQFDSAYNLLDIYKKGTKEGLYISKPYVHFSKKKDKNATRLGFASMNEKEIEAGFQILSDIVKKS